MAPPAKRASKRRRTSNKEEPKEEEGRTSNKDEPKEEDDNRKGQQVEETATGGDTAKAIKVTSAEKGTNGKSPVIVFAHGAGAPSSSDWMIRWKEMLHKALNAVEVVTFDYPYISGGKRRAPPKAEKLVEFHIEVVRKTITEYQGHPLILVGKSMGSRVSCMVAVGEDIGAEAVICLGYPLKGMKGTVRDETLLKLTVPVMFVQGSKDSLCPLEKLDAVRKKMNSVAEMYVVEGGDHSFKIGKKHLQTTGSTQEEAENLAVQAISTFVSNILEEK